jgi:integrase
MVTEHKRALLAARPRLEPIRYILEPGEHVGSDGERIIATERDLIFLDAAGKLLRTMPNGPAQRLVNPPLGPAFDVSKIAQIVKTGPTRSGDDAILETYLDHRKIEGYDRREAETVWATYKNLVGKPLKEASRDDGRLLVQRFKDDGNKTATINKKIGWLRAAVQYAIAENKLKFNPFSNVVPNDDDELDRKPLDDTDMKACRKNLDTLTEADQLLFRILATTGMRLSEAFQINDEEPKEAGIRFVIIGKKTKQSRRRVPFPKDLLDHLPTKIEGPMFGAYTRANTRAASKRLNRFLDDCGIVDPEKVVHSLRHRAQDRLRAAGVRKEEREAVLGHGEMTVGEGYGEGYPVKMLRKWIDHIGM